MRSFFSMCSVAGGEEDVDARRLAALQRLGGAARCRGRWRAPASRPSSPRIAWAIALHRLEVAVRRRGEAGLDHVDLEPLELARDAQLLVLGHRGAGRLLAVAQGGVEDDQAVGHGDSPARKQNGPLRLQAGRLDETLGRGRSASPARSKKKQEQRGTNSRRHRLNIAQAVLSGASPVRRARRSTLRSRSPACP